MIRGGKGSVDGCGVSSMISREGKLKGNELEKSVREKESY